MTNLRHMSKLRPMKDELLTSAQVAERFRVSVRTVNRWAESGRLPVAVPLLGRTAPNLFSPAAVDAFEVELNPEPAS